MSPVGVTSTPPGLRSARIGRYQILGTLGAGGMAEVLLGRLVGPSGFERLVVVKRILPHLAGRRAFVDMFLDEARVVAQIRHPNVVTVHELGNEDGELFLVMEYLDGESAGGLLRRLSVKRERLPFAVAAYVVAEACAGLHAAHELTSPTGESLHVVHRDVSPQNVFVTYSGAVKVLDFGIALAGDRQTRTEAGQIKGKFEYMSPEQWREEPLDRRADVFALGIVLYELSTGHRLFRRATHLETLEAICEAPIPKPSTLVPDYPPLLERVCMRALERNREDRYATAADMRRELLPFVNAEDLEPEATLARVMAKTFADRIEEKRSMVRAARTGDALAQARVDRPRARRGSRDRRGDLRRRASRSRRPEHRAHGDGKRVQRDRARRRAIERREPDARRRCGRCRSDRASPRDHGRAPRQASVVAESTADARRAAQLGAEAGAPPRLRAHPAVMSLSGAERSRDRSSELGVTAARCVLFVVGAVALATTVGAHVRLSDRVR